MLNYKKHALKKIVSMSQETNDTDKVNKSIDRKQPPEVFYKKDFLKNFSIFTGKQLRWSLFSIKLHVCSPTTLFKRDSTQVFCCEYCEIFKNTHFEEHLRAAASVLT